MEINESVNVQIKNHSSIFYNNKLIIFGGYDGKKNHNELHIFDILKNEWMKISTSGSEPEARNGHSATLVNKKMYVIGGWLGSGTFASNDVYILNLENYQWKQCQT